VLLNGPTALIVALTLSVVALFGKWIAAFVTQIVFKYSKAQRQLIFGLSGAHAAATLAIILVGYEAKILDENILNGTIILILITCIVASFATEKAAKQIIVESENDTSDISKDKKDNEEHILLPIANVENMDKLLEFAVFIKDKKSPNPLSILSVVSNNDEAEINIIKARNKLEEFAKQAIASETKVNILTTIDHNAASGISRISREIMADIIVLGWPKKTGFIDKLIGEKVDSILTNTDKNTFICHLVKPLILHKRIVIASPPFSEREKGFENWLLKIAKLAQELSLPISLYCNELTGKAFEDRFKKFKFASAVSINQFSEWEDFLVLARNIHENDLFVLVSARKSAPSYMSVLENLPIKIEKHFKANSKLLIYPEQYNPDGLQQGYDIATEPLNMGIETIQKITKGIGNLFRSKKND
ncbi:MAG: universal stress protein, partial [Leptospiraceae bacterium]|nr:universal stress protein [Leptospiraceae bacterium]